MGDRASGRRRRAPACESRGLALALLAALVACGPGEGSEPAPASAPEALRDAGEYAQEGDFYGEDAGAGEGEAPGVAADEVERLQALGYLQVVDTEDTDLPVGVLESDPQRLQPGLTYFTNAMGCSSQLVDSEGRVVRSWSLEPCDLWGNSTLLSDGSVLAIHRSPTSEETPESLRGVWDLVKLDWEGRVLWRSRLAAHHDVDELPDGRIATLVYGFRVLPDFHPTAPVRDHSIAVLSPEGRLLEQHSIGDIVLSTPGYPVRMRRARKRDGALQVDLLHVNSIEWMRRPELAARSPLYSLSNVLICLRHQDSIAVIDWERKRIVWSWGQGILSGPHDATMLPNGHILVFDNGLSRRWSRAVEMDPGSGEIVWEYRAPTPADFFTIHRGAAQRLANGNTLLTDSNAGVAFEVTPAGETVWRFRNPNRWRGKPIVIVRARRLQVLDEAAHRFERSD